jgi:hypothetical protein
MKKFVSFLFLLLLALACWRVPVIAGPTVAVLGAIALVAIFNPVLRARRLVTAINIAEGRHQSGRITKTADVDFASRYLLVKTGTDIDHIAICGAADRPMGVCPDSPLTGALAAVNVLGAATETQLMTASGAIALQGGVYTDANGMVQADPTVAGTYWLVGTALNPTTLSGDTIEVEPIRPLKVVVLAKFNSVQNATTAAVDLATSEALANALKANYNALQTDVAALGTALGTPALVKVLTV